VSESTTTSHDDDGAPQTAAAAPAPQPVAYSLPAPQPVAYSLPAPQAAPYQPAQLGAGPIGKVRGTGVVILLSIITLGIYGLFWTYQVHEEMKRHKGTGLGGGIALLLAIFVGIVMPYLTSSEAGELYERRGQAKPVSGLTGLWYFPGMFILVGPLVWFVKTNGAINAYWRSLGAR
jgi:uncharacterized protein DUF4234